MAHSRIGVFSLVLLGILCAPPVPATERLTLHLVIEGRVVTTPVSKSVLDGGLGKTRYGHEPRAVELKLAQAALLGQFEPRPDLVLRAHANIDAERNFRRRVDLVEAQVRFNPAIGDRTALDIRAGLFFPQVSMENTDPGWLSPYTTTFSALNAWIGEEVRTLGVEAGPSFTIGEAQARVFGAAHRGNDPSGTLLAWRGFALHDRVSGFADRLPLPPLRSFDRPDLFPDQPPYVQPMREVDQEWTWSSGITLTHPGYRVKALYQPPTANPIAFDGEQYAWRTGYWSMGASRSAGPLEFLAQGLWGDTRMGRVADGRPAVIARFETAYLLLSWEAPQTGRHRASARYDAFRVRDRDDFRAADANDESGTAWTFAYAFVPTSRHRITAELVRVKSSRTNRRDLGLEPRGIEILGSLSWRVTF